MTASGGPHQADLLVVNAAQLVTCAGFSSAPARGPAQSELGIIQNGALAIQGDRLAAVGTTEQVCSRFQSDEVLDAGGSVVLPGFVDPHTHLVFAGDRADEWEAQLRGESYLEIARRGGGILRTVSSTRAATFEELLAGARRWAELMLRHGTTCFEAKSGYCLDLEGEMKLLRVARGLPAETNQKVCSTLLAAHVVPPEYENDREEYLKLCERALERARGEDLVDFADVFCEAEAFTLEEAERILQHAKAHGVGVKLHAEQFSATGAATLGARLGAVSVDHLDALRSSSLREFAAIEPAPIAVLLPAAAFHLGVSQAAPARALIEAGVPVALATDFNPGTSFTPSMPMVIALACRLLALSVDEALIACTINAAHALRLGALVGSLEVGKRADVLVCGVPDYRWIGYAFGFNPVRSVILAGRLV